MTARAEVEEIMEAALYGEGPCMPATRAYAAELRKPPEDRWVRPSGRGVLTEYEELMDELAGNKPSHTPWVVGALCLLALAVVVGMALS